MAFPLQLEWQKHKKLKNHKIYVIVGDGELNEGANWGTLSASQNKLGNLKVVVDCNKIQLIVLQKT